MRGLLQVIRDRTGVTILHITHSLADARALADRVLVLAQGKVSENAALVRQNETYDRGADGT
jgi:ABC-type sulfate/molybdate transport systems ATPase subunit